MTLAANRTLNQTMQASDVGGRSMGAFKQRQAEKITYEIDYSFWLADGETISSIVYGMEPATDPAVVIVGSTIQDGSKALFQIDNGLEGKRYVINVTATTSTGQTKLDFFTVAIGSFVYDAAFYDVKTASSEVVQAKQQVELLAEAVSDAKDAVAADRAVVAADKATVSADKAIVAGYKADVAADKTIVASDKATVAADKAVVATDKATAVDAASTATQKATEAAIDRAVVQSIVAAIQSGFLGAFASDAAAEAFAVGKGITITDGIMYQNTVADKFRIYNGSAWQDYDATAQASQSSAALSATNAAASESLANSHKIAAQSARDGAVAAQTAVETIRTDFYAVYLGTFNGDAAANNTASANGLGSVNGLRYYNYTTGKFRVRSGGTWSDEVLPGDSAIAAAASATSAQSAKTAAEAARDLAQGYAASAGSGMIFGVLNVAALRLVPVTSNQVIELLGYNSANDGGGGMFYGVPPIQRIGYIAVGVYAGDKSLAYLTDSGSSTGINAGDLVYFNGVYVGKVFQAGAGSTAASLQLDKNNSTTGSGTFSIIRADNSGTIFPSGASGYWQRVENINSPGINVLWFGAVANTTDDNSSTLADSSPAVAAALAASYKATRNKSILYFPNGLYRLNSPISGTNIGILGDEFNGATTSLQFWATRIHYYGAGVCMDLFSVAVLDKIKLVSKGTGQAGIRVGNTIYGRIQNIEINEFDQFGFCVGKTNAEGNKTSGAGTYYSSFKNINVINTTAYGKIGFMVIGNQTGNANSNTFENIGVKGLFSAALDIGGNGNKFIAGEFSPINTAANPTASKYTIIIRNNNTVMDGPYLEFKYNAVIPPFHASRYAPITFAAPSTLLLFAKLPVDGDTITISGVTITYRTSGANPALNEINIGASIIEANQNLADFINNAATGALANVNADDCYDIIYLHARTTVGLTITVSSPSNAILKSGGGNQPSGGNYIGPVNFATWQGNYSVQVRDLGVGNEVNSGRSIWFGPNAYPQKLASRNLICNSDFRHMKTDGSGLPTGWYLTGNSPTFATNSAGYMSFFAKATAGSATLTDAYFHSGIVVGRRVTMTTGFNMLFGNGTLTSTTITAVDPIAKTVTLADAPLSGCIGNFSMSITANTTIGSPTLTSVSIVDQLYIGQKLSGTGIPASAVISSIDVVNSTVTMSANATANGTGIVVTPSNSGNGTLGFPTALAGVQAGLYRITFTGATTFDVYDPTDVNIGSGTTGVLFNTGAQISFTITAGTSAFVSGDSFTILRPSNTGSSVSRVTTPTTNGARYALKFFCEVGSRLELNYQLSPAGQIPQPISYNKLKNTTISVGVWCKSSTPGVGIAVFLDGGYPSGGAGQNFSSGHSGSGNWEFLTTNGRMPETSINSDFVRFVLSNSYGARSVVTTENQEIYFTDPVVVFGDQPPEVQQPLLMDDTDAASFGRLTLNPPQQLLSSAGANNSTTPDVAQFNLFNEQYTSATNVSQFLNGRAGQEITIFTTTANITFVHNSGATANTLYMKGAANVVSAANRAYKFMFNGTKWFEV